MVGSQVGLSGATAACVLSMTAAVEHRVQTHREWKNILSDLILWISAIYNLLFLNKSSTIDNFQQSIVMSASLENLETQLEMFIENVRQIRIIVSDFQPQGQSVLNQKIQSLVTGLQEVDKLKSQVHDILVPTEVFDYIDQGRNPQLYTKDCIDKALAKNEEVKGKIDSYKRFKSHLLSELSKTFPNEIAKYKAIRGGE